MFLGIFSCLVGIISGYGILDFLPSRWDGRAALPFGNPNFYCTYCCLVTAISMGVIFYAEDKRFRFLGYVGYSFSIMAGLETNGSMCFSGNICAILLVIFVELVLRRGKKSHLILRKQMLKMFCLIIIYVALILLNEFTRDSAFSNEMLANWNDLEKGWFADSWFSGRMGVWKAAFRVLPDYWLHGVGVDCFQSAMSSPKLNGRFIRFDKAHNEYLQILLTEGVFACITYIWFLFIIFIRGLKQSVQHIENKDFTFLALFLAFFSYIAQAFFNISVPNIAPYFWIFCGLFYERK